MTQDSNPPLPSTPSPPIDRPFVRSLVQANAERLQAHGDEGGSIPQLALDQQDEIQKFAATLSAADQAAFWELYIQEMRASTQDALTKTAEINAATSAKVNQKVQHASNVSIWISIIAFFIMLSILLSTLRK